MKSYETRQQFLSFMGSKCICDLCKHQEDNVGTTEDQNETRSKIDKWTEEAQKLQQDLVLAREEGDSNPSKMCELYPPEKCRKQIECYKQLYKHGRAAKANFFDLYQILVLGYEAGFFGCKVSFYKETMLDEKPTIAAIRNAFYTKVHIIG